MSVPVQPGISGPLTQKLSSLSAFTGSKWPISPDWLTLKVCAAQVVHAVGWPVEVGAAAVLYIGWKAYGAPLHVRFTGSNRMWRKPLATLATIEPLSPVLLSVTAADSPAAVSWMLTLITSPWFIRSTAGVGVNDLLFCVSGPGGPIGFPVFVRYAKLTGSGQLGLATAPGMLP